MCYKMSRQAFEIGLAHLILFCNSNGNLNVPEDYICSDGYALGEFVGRIRCMYRKKQGATESDNPGTLTQNQIKRLDFIGFSFEKELADWEYMYKLAADYVRMHDELPKRNYRTDDNVLLGAWVWRQRGIYAILSRGQQEKLSQIGI